MSYVLIHLLPVTPWAQRAATKSFHLYLSRATMSYVKYQPSSHKPVTREEIQSITDDLKYDCSFDQVKAITVLDSLCEPIPLDKYPRTTGYRAAPDHIAGNAWTWRCNIQGATSGKLSGKTFAIKDNTAVAGVPMSNGSKLLQGYIPEYDATVVSRILDAGGRILGKASCDDFCLSAMGFSSLDGYVTMPNSPDYRVGGSSCGSGVLVATKQVDMAIAVDQGGSTRIPAAWTGTVGMKPTHGLVPYTGVVSIEPTVDNVGPICRNVTDCALFLEVIAGNDGLDGRQIADIEIPEYSKLLEPGIRHKKLGLLKEGLETCVPETQKAITEFLRSVGLAGFDLGNVSVPLHKHGATIFTGFIAPGSNACFQLGTAGQFSQGFYPTSLEKAVRHGRQCSGNLLAPGIKNFTTLGELMTRRYGNHYYCKSRNLVLELTRQYDEALKTCDVIVMPTLTHVASKIPSRHPTEEQSQIEYLKESTDMLANTAAANLTGHPALTLPLGKLGDGSKDSLMIVGRADRSASC